VILPLTGPLSEFGPNFQKAAELAVDHFKAAGYEIEIKVADDETSATPGVQAARRLVDVDKVNALVGAAASSVSIAVATGVSIPKEIPQVSYASTSPLLTILPEDQGKDFLFRDVPSDALQGLVLGKLAKEQGFNTVSILYVNNPYGQGLKDNFAKSYEAAGGKVLEAVPHPEEAQATYVAEIKKAVAGKPDALVAISYPQHATVYLKEAIEGNYIKKFLFCDGTKSLDIVKAVGAANVEGMVGTAPGSKSSEFEKAFNEQYKTKYGELPPLPYMTNSYDAVAILALAALRVDKEGKALTGKNIRDQIRNVSNPPGEVVGAGADGIKQAVKLIKEDKDVNYEGASGSVDFDANGDTVTPVEVWKYQGGNIVSVRLEDVKVP
jgi:ABC-type branched-subunit amino acid transport system substrate-binding protein